MSENPNQVEYEGPVGHEKKLHKTHFHVEEELKLKDSVPIEDDPKWKRIGPSRWVKIG